MRQLDLFTVAAEPASFGVVDREGWERRVLSDLERGHLTYCFPGFMGDICEGLVAQGLVAKEPAGFLPPPEGLTATQLKKWGWRAEDHPQFRYSRAA